MMSLRDELEAERVFLAGLQRAEHHNRAGVDILPAAIIASERAIAAIEAAIALGR